MAAAPIHLDVEDVSLTGPQLDCGVQNDLWEQPGAVDPSAGQRSVARLLDAGRALHFDDDVVVSEPGYRQAYVQLRGDFTVQLGSGMSVKDDGPDHKLVEGKLGVTIPHMCFPDPLPMMGVKKGKFSEEANPVMEFSLQNDGWHFIKLDH